jgi:hypothetical protein
VSCFYVKVKKGEKSKTVDSDNKTVKRKVIDLKLKTNGDTIDDQASKGKETTKKLPRIHIKLQVNDEKSKKSESIEVKTERKKPAKRKRDDDEVEEVDSAAAEAKADPAPIPKRRKNDTNQVKKRALKVAASSGDSTTHPVTCSNEIAGGTPNFLDITFWRQCRESLNGTFKAARKNLTQVDGWFLPDDLSDKFCEIANITLEKMNK